MTKDALRFRQPLRVILYRLALTATYPRHHRRACCFGAIFKSAHQVVVAGAVLHAILSRMKLIFLHGGPASGKLTVAKALLRTVPGRLFDNHAAIDLALTVFDFGAPGFWELVHAARLSVLQTAAEHGVPLVVATYCYAEPDDRAAFEQFDEIVQRHGGELLPVFLYCSKEEAIRRVENADRVKRRKITSEAGLNKFFAQYNISPVPRSDCLVLDSETRSADVTAQEIIRHFDLIPARNS